MLLVISPAKNLDYETPVESEFYSQPDFLEDAEELIEQLRGLPPHDVSALMKISDKLGLLNYDRYQSWSRPFDRSNARQAMLAFNGDVYSGLGATDFTDKDLKFAQQHLRILSGLYGLLRPMDLMQPYRLEMGTRFNNHRGKDLYQFWGSTITEALNQQLTALKTDVLVNLASNEYFKSVKREELKGRVVTPVFKDWKNGQYKIISFYAKKARGLMGRYAILERLTHVDQLKQFDLEGYSYAADLSSVNEWVFTRKV